MESTQTTGRPPASGIGVLWGVTWTLIVSTAVFVGFLLAPMIVLGLAFLVYWAWPGSVARKPKKPAQQSTADDQEGAEQPAYRFGTGG